MQCSQQVRIPDHSIPRYRQCVNPAKVERDGCAYCGVHDPVGKEARENTPERLAKKAKVEANRRAMWAAEMRIRERRRLAKSTPKQP